jgi:alpha-glucosidase
MRVHFLTVLFILGISGAVRAQAPSGTTQLGDVTSISSLPYGVELHAGPAVMRIDTLRRDVLRVRVAPDGVLPEDASWAVLPDARRSGLLVRPEITPTEVTFITESLKVRIERSPLRLIVEDLAGNVITEDAPGRPVEFAGKRDPQGGEFHVWKTLRDDEHFFGLGDKTGPLDRRGEAFNNWNTDAYGFQESTDPIYKTIPFFIGEHAGHYYGIFLDNTWRTSFDFGSSLRDDYSFASDGGPLDYYIVDGPDPKKVVEAYAWLTGPSPLPPLWSLGFQQSRYSYAPESVAREVAEHLRKDKIPSDVLWLDIDYQYKNRPFTVDPAAFPDMPKFVADMKALHLHTIAITDLHIAEAANQGYAPYDTGKAADAFVKKPDGTDYVGVVWPGNSVFPDFTHQASREWWGTNYKQFVQMGFAGFWNDMNEPSVFNGPGKTMPLDTVHRVDGTGFQPRTATHREIHNVFGMQNARATFEGVLKLNPDERPFVMTRATYAGGQRYSVTWTGDNSSTWNHLRMSTTMLENLGLSGYAFAGADVGGFAGSPQPDLLTKWLEVAAFQPIDRDHTSKGTRQQEVWVDGPKQEAVRRHFIETRYRLMPYLYSLAEETSRTGLPMIRPLFLEFPMEAKDGHPIDLDASGEFMLGPDLLIAAPAYYDLVDKYAPTLPGEGWFNFWTGARVPKVPSLSAIAAATQASPDGTTLQSPEMKQAMKAIEDSVIEPKLDELPVFVRAGSILPMQPLVQSTDETPNGPLELRVYPGSNCKGELYGDDGHSFQYQHDQYLRVNYSCKVTSTGVSVSLEARQGKYAPWWKQVDVVVYGWTSAQVTAALKGEAKPLTARVDTAAHAVHVLLPESASAQDLTLTAK